MMTMVVMMEEVVVAEVEEEIAQTKTVLLRMASSMLRMDRLRS